MVSFEALLFFFFPPALATPVYNNANSSAIGQPTPTPPVVPDNCTFTLSTTETRPHCRPNNGLVTIYPFTVTASHAIDCHGCSHFHVAGLAGYPCPAAFVTGSVEVPTPRTVHKTICATAQPTH